MQDDLGDDDTEVRSVAGSGADEDALEELDETHEGAGDTQERIRVAAGSAADAAEQRAIEEILALEDDLRRAEERAEAAELRAREAEADRDTDEVATREAAAEWLRGQVRALRHEAERKVEEGVHATQREADERVRAADQRGSSEKEPGDFAALE